MKSLYVGNLPHGATDSELRNMFAIYGAVQNVNMITDRDTGRARGFAFVEMPNSSEAEMAIVGLNGSGLGGRTLNVSEAKPKTDRPRGSGRQRFGRGSGGRDNYHGHARANLVNAGGN
jgi:cold-inducible RNA-binding protein